MLLGEASSIAEADERLAPRADPAAAAALVPPEWADGDAYAEFLATRLERRASGRRRPSVPERRSPFQYAALRVIPRVERGEAVNAGVVLFCRPLRFLGARTHLDEALLARALAEAATRPRSTRC